MKTNLITLMFAILMIASVSCSTKKAVEPPKPTHAFTIERDSTGSVAIYTTERPAIFPFDDFEFLGQIQIISGCYSSGDEGWLKKEGLKKLNLNSKGKVDFIYFPNNGYNIFINGKQSSFDCYSGNGDYGINKNSWFLTKRMETPKTKKAYGLFLDSIEVFPCIYKSIKFIHPRLIEVLDEFGPHYFLVDSLMNVNYLRVAETAEVMNSCILIKVGKYNNLITFDGKTIIDSIELLPDVKSIDDYFYPGEYFKRKGYIGFLNTYGCKADYPLIRYDKDIIFHKTINFANERLYLFSVREKSFLVTSTGQSIFPEDAKTLIVGNGILWFKVDDGYVNYDGNKKRTVIPTTRYQKNKFDNGVIFVKDPGGWGCLDSKGTMIISTELGYKNISWDKNEDLIVCSYKKGDEVFYDLNGSVIKKTIK